MLQGHQRKEDGKSCVLINGAEVSASAPQTAISNGALIGSNASNPKKRIANSHNGSMISTSDFENINNQLLHSGSGQSNGNTANSARSNETLQCIRAIDAGNGFDARIMPNNAYGTEQRDFVATRQKADGSIHSVKHNVELVNPTLCPEVLGQVGKGYSLFTTSDGTTVAAKLVKNPNKVNTNSNKKSKNNQNNKNNP